MEEGNPNGRGERDDAERDEAVREHLAALDDEIARLRRMEAALDKRIAAADDERRAIEERMEDDD
jgi:cell division protein FtsB